MADTLLGLLGAPETGNSLRQIAYNMNPSYQLEKQRLAQSERSALADLNLQERMMSLRERQFADEQRATQEAASQRLRQRQALSQLPQIRSALTGLEGYSAGQPLPGMVGPQPISTLQDVQGLRGLESNLLSDLAMGGGPLAQLSAEKLFGVQKQPQTVVNVGQGGSIFEQEFEKGQAKALSDLTSQATQSLSQQAQLDQMDLLLNQGAITGFGAEQVAQLGSIARALGADVGDGVSSTEALRSISNQLALQIRNPDSGMGLPGATSDRDIRFLQESIAGLRDTPEGIRKKIDLARAVNARKQDIADYAASLAENYLSQGKRVPTNFESQVARYARENLNVRNYLPENWTAQTEQGQTGTSGQQGGFRLLGVE